MEVSDISMQELMADGVCPPNYNLQLQLFEATRKADLAKVRSLCQLNCDLNCVDSSGKDLLQVAGELENVSVRREIIETLLSSGADLEFALLNEVRDSNIQMVEVLLQFYQPALLSSPKRYVNPLILAACLQNFQIITMLLDNGFSIGEAKISQWSSGSNPVCDERFEPAVYRSIEYRALASPVFIAASFLQDVYSGPDPIYRACVLNKELREIAEREYELKHEYFELSDGCKEFTVALLKECHSVEEIRCVMEMHDIADGVLHVNGNLNTLKLATVSGNDKFVSHPFSQLILNSEVYRNVPFLEKSAWKQAVLILLADLTYPLLFMVSLLFDSCFPYHDVASMFHSPCVTFLIHCGSYQTFLLLLAFASFYSKSAFLAYGITDWMVLAFVIGHLIDVIRDVYQQGRAHFFSFYWNVLAIASVASLLLHHVIWWAGRSTLTQKPQSMTWESHADDRGYTVILVSFCILAVAILLAFARNLSFLQANSNTGPLLQAFLWMLIDVVKFFLYFIFVFLAFAVSFTNLYLQYDKASHHFHMNKSGTNQSDSLDLQRFGNSMSTIFWTLFGLIDEDSFKINVDGYGAIWKTGITLFAAYNVVVVIVALNMLIAIINESYSRITENLDTEWKFTRTRIWLSWIYKKGVLPPPFNILYVLLPVRWFIKYLFTACCPGHLLKLTKRKPYGSNSKVKQINEKKRREIIRQLVLRYLARRPSDLDTGTQPNVSVELACKQALQI